MYHVTYADRRDHTARHSIKHTTPLRWLHSKLRDLIDNILYERVVV